MKILTFILPTFNRKNYIIRAVESCLIVAGKNFSSEVLIIDGESTDGAWELLEENYKDNKRVKLLQLPKNMGFQKTAFYGVSQVKSEYCTFMYNDDVLSPHFSKLFSKMIENEQNFVMGYGKNFDINKVYQFKPLNLKLIDNKR